MQPNLTPRTGTKGTIMKNTLLALLGFILLSTLRAATARQSTALSASFFRIT